MTYQIGQTYPLEAEPITGAEIEPAWFALQPPLRKDFALVSFLRHKGMRAFAPEKTVIKRGRGRQWTVTLPALPGFVYAQFTEIPHWHVMRYRRIINGVMTNDGVPIVIPDRQIGEIKGLAEAMEAQEAARVTINPGDRIRVTQGLFEGYHVEVSEVRGGMAWFDSLGLGKIGAKISDVAKDE